MQFIKTALRLVVFFLPVFSYGQSSSLPGGSKFRQLADRMDIKLMNDPYIGFNSNHPILRKDLMEAIQQYYGREALNDGGTVLITTGPEDSSGRFSVTIDTLRQGHGERAGLFTAIDRYSMSRALMNNSEWYNGDKGRFKSKKSWWNTFYNTPADFFQVDKKDFFLAVNPVIQEQQSKEKGSGERVFLNSRGLTLRGLIAGRVGFDFYLTENQERTPLFVRDWVQGHKAVPGMGFYKSFKGTAYDYIDGRGSVYFTAAKFIRFQFGYDKNFIGNGYRSLFLSDFANSNLFFKINTRIWKLDYQNLFMELIPQFIKQGDELLPRKYAASHHLSVQATKWLNLGLFETVIFGRKDHFDFTYLNPVIFLRLAEQQAGSPDNALVGFDIKANIAKRVQLYSQLLLDEFKLDELKSGKGWWGNKFGVQAGAKYIDAFAVKNLDLQGEVNVVRPFTYTHSDGVANYTHYNQPLAHPLGANFAEMIGIINYQPFKKWYAQVKLIAFRQGIDTADKNYGANIFLPYTTRSMDYGNRIGSGVKSTGINTALWIGYELKENLFLDASLLYRRQQVDDLPELSPRTTLFTLGIRMNMARRVYDY